MPRTLGDLEREIRWWGRGVEGGRGLSSWPCGHSVTIRVTLRVQWSLCHQLGAVGDDVVVDAYGPGFRRTRERREHDAENHEPAHRQHIGRHERVSEGEAEADGGGVQQDHPRVPEHPREASPAGPHRNGSLGAGHPNRVCQRVDIQAVCC
eukprot:1189082-Prorocentrum_minimum.AAC.2